jgi:hypothetical protein
MSGEHGGAGRVDRAGHDGAGLPRPAMLTTPATAPYWAAAAEGRLLLQRCRSC